MKINKYEEIELSNLKFNIIGPIGYVKSWQSRTLSKVIYFSTINCILFVGLNLNGVGIYKILITSLMLISFFYLLLLSIKYLQKNSLLMFSRYYKWCLSALIFYGLIISFRSLNLNGDLLTLFGNPYGALTWLTPIAFIFGSQTANLKTLNNISLNLIKYAILIAPILLLIDKKLGLYGFYFLSNLYFLPLLTWKYQKNVNKKWIILSVIFFLFYSYIGSVRIGFVQVTLQISALVVVSILDSLKRGSSGILKFVVFFFILLAVLFLITEKGDYFLPNLSNEDKLDTRSFLYLEVFENLTKANDLIFGRGALGTYYSDFFYHWQEIGGTDGDESTRITVEVGFLHMLLKGGWVMVILFFLVCLPAALQAVFYSNNIIAKLMGLYSLIYLAIVFISNRPLYSNVYIVYWIVIGLCASTKFRNMKDNLIKFELT